LGDTPGVIPRCKTGDFVVTLGPDSSAAGAAIVVEAKASSACTLKATLVEADEARRNRAASVCLFVHAAATAPAGLPKLHRWGQDIVLVWDAEDPATDVRLKAGYLLAKALCVRASRHEVEDAAIFAEIDGAIEAIRKQIAGFDEIRICARTVISGGEKIVNRARLMEEEIDKRMAALATHIERLRAASAETET